MPDGNGTNVQVHKMQSDYDDSRKKMEMYRRKHYWVNLKYSLAPKTEDSNQTGM